MSLATWKAEFYPVKASEVSKEDAVEHSLVKWRGLRPAALAAHSVFTDDDADLADDADGYLSISSSSCALCATYMCRCSECPLSAARGGKSCCSLAKGEKESPYDRWLKHQDPEPMIASLEKALKEQQHVSD